MSLIDIVILNYRTAGLTVDCLRSLEPEIAAIRDARVTVVDNASGDGSAEVIATAILQEGWSTWATLLPLSRNGGYSAGNNAGLRRALSADPPADYVLLLNPDTIVRPRALRTLLDFMEGNPEVGIAGSRLEDLDGRVDSSARRMPTPLGEFEGAARTGPITRLLSRYVVSPPAEITPCQCDWVSGASMLIRRAVIEQIVLMDEGYFLYFDEVDYCMRAKRAGWQCWYVPDARIVHLEGQSTGIKTQGRRARYWFESRRRFFTKHYGMFGLIAADCLWAMGRAVWWIRRFMGLGAKSSTDPAWFAWDLLVGDLRAVLRGETLL